MSLNKITRSLITVGTAATVAVAGAGVATAQETGDTPDSSSPTSGSAEISNTGSLDPAGSVDAHGWLNPFNEDDAIDLEVIGDNLTALAPIFGGVAAAAGAATAVFVASNHWQTAVNDTLGFLAANGITLPN